LRHVFLFIGADPAAVGEGAAVVAQIHAMFARQTAKETA
jgi:hypothetical protein